MADAVGRGTAVLRRPRWLEALVISALFVCTLFGAGASMSPNWQDRTFYQYEFGPAVMYACGHGLRPAPRQAEVDSFLTVKQQSLDCAELGAVGPGASLNAFQAAHRYLLQTLGVAWRVWGVDWRVADHLSLILYALTCVLGYVLLRVFLPMGWSVFGLLLYATAGTHLIYLNSLRDYAKAPFVLAVLICLSWLLKQRRPWASEGVIALLMGCALGVGLGFRMDLLIFVPFVVGMTVVFYPAPLKEAWKNRLLIPLAAVATAYACAYPVLSAMAQGSNSAHVILLGLSHEFGELLGLHSADYQFASYYNDAYQRMQIDILASIQGQPQHLDFSSPMYETFGYRLLGEYLQLFPADLWLRGMAAIVQGLGYDFNLRLGLAGGGALVVVGLAILGLCLHSMRLGLAFAFAIAFLFAFPVLQFNLRHFFYLSIVPILCVGLLAHGTSLWIGSALSRRIPRPGMDRRVLTHLIVAAGALVVPMLVWLALWPVQFTQQANMLQRVRGLPVDWVSSVQGQEEDGASVHLTSAQLGPDRAARLGHDSRGKAGNVLVGYYWVIDVDRHRQGCQTNRFRGAIKYRASLPYYDFTRSFSYIVDGATRIFLPVVEIQQQAGAEVMATPDSMIVDGTPWACVARVGTAAPDASFPLLLDMAIPLETERTHLQPALPVWMAGERPLHHTVASSPGLPGATGIDMLQWRGAETALVLSAGDVLGGAAVTLTENGMRMDGTVKGRYSYLVRIDAVEFRSGDVLKVSGVLGQGGLAVGLLKDGAWAHQLPVVRPGEFDLFMAPEPGQYQVVISNNLVWGGSVNTFEIQHLGVVRKPD